MKGKSGVEKDPFAQDQPQVSNVYKHRVPPDLRPFDDAKGGLHVKRELTDDGFTSDFVPPQQKEYNFSKGRKK